MYFETLFFKHNKYILHILQHFTQSRRLRNIVIVLEGDFKNMNDWISNNLHTNLIKYIIDSQMHTTNNTGRAINELMNQGVKIGSIQCYNTYQESILLDLVIESDIYNDYSYVSCVDWKIEKTSEAHLKKLEFNIDKSKTNLKKIDFNINVNNNEINDMNDEEAVHPSDDLTDDDYSNIENHETQHK